MTDPIPARLAALKAMALPDLKAELRTLFGTEPPGYNPVSYHTGSVWPHDNGIIAGGFARYGYRDEAALVARGIFDATERFQANRVPELFSGLARTEGSFHSD